MRWTHMHTNIHPYIHTYIHLEKDVERERGRKNCYVQNMRQDVAMILYENTTIATKPVSGPLLEGEREGPGLTGAKPLMISTREYCNRI